MKKERIQAIKSRANLGLDSYSPIENIANLLFKKENISIIKKKLKGKISGACALKGEVRAILINSSYSLGRQNFTLAHEYYHLLYDEEFNNYSSDIETSANTFASYFLMPKEALELYMSINNLSTKKDTLNEVDILKMCVYFKMSFLAILVRLEKFEKLLSKSKVEEYKKINAGVLAKANGIYTDLFKSTDEEFLIKTDYVDQAKKALEKNKISIGKYEDLLLQGGFEDVVFGFDTEHLVGVVDGEFEDYI